MCVGCVTVSEYRVFMHCRAADYENLFTRPELYPEVLREKIVSDVLIKTLCPRLILLVPES